MNYNVPDICASEEFYNLWQNTSVSCPVSVIPVLQQATEKRPLSSLPTAKFSLLRKRLHAAVRMTDDSQLFPVVDDIDPSGETSTVKMMVPVAGGNMVARCKMVPRCKMVARCKLHMVCCGSTIFLCPVLHKPCTLYPSRQARA